MRKLLIYGLTLTALTFTSLNTFAGSLWSDAPDVTSSEKECLTRLNFPIAPIGEVGCNLSKIIKGKAADSQLCFGLYNQQESKETPEKSNKYKLVTFEPGGMDNVVDLATENDKGADFIYSYDSNTSLEEILTMTLENKLTHKKIENTINYSRDTLTRKVYKQNPGWFEKDELVESYEYHCQRLN